MERVAGFGLAPQHCSKGTEKCLFNRSVKIVEDGTGQPVVKLVVPKKSRLVLELYIEEVNNCL